MTVHLIVSGNYSPAIRLIENMEIEAGMDVRFNTLFNPDALQNIPDKELSIILCEDGHTGISWKEYAGIARQKNRDVFFILLNAGISQAELYLAGADLAISPDKPLILKDCLKERMTRQIRPVSAGPEPDNLSQMLSEMQEKNRELEKMSFELDRFVYSASHDLRAPLTSVLGLLYLLRDELKDDAALHYVGLMEDSILKLDNTIRDIVAYSRNNRLEIVSEPIVLSELVHDIIAGLRYLETDAFSLQDVISIDDPGLFYSDRGRLQVILNNLLANSVRYRQPGRKPQIRVSCRVNGNLISLKVEDNGIGISDRHIDRIFDMFYRSNEGSTGSGLGLYIVRETIRKMGGTVKVTSNPPEGTCFLIEIPQVIKQANEHAHEKA